MRCSRKRRLCSMVAAGRSLMSSSRSLPAAFSSSFGGVVRSLLRREGVPLSCLPRVALDRGEANVEQAGSLGLAGPTFEGGHYLPAEVFGVGFHPLMSSSGSRFLINAIAETRAIKRPGDMTTTPHRRSSLVLPVRHQRYPQRRRIRRLRLFSGAGCRSRFFSETQFPAKLRERRSAKPRAPPGTKPPEPGRNLPYRREVF